MKQENTIHFNIKDTHKNIPANQIKETCYKLRKPDETNFTKKINQTNNTIINNTTLNHTFPPISNDIKANYKEQAEHFIQ